jgi:hypothetical protein
MKDVELYAKVRHAVRIEGLSKRAVARRFGIDPRTVDKMLEFSVPPGLPAVEAVAQRVRWRRVRANAVCGPATRS